MDTRHFVESFSLHVEQEALLCFVLKAILEFGALIPWAPTENRLLGNTFELPLTRRESSDLVNFLLEWTGFDSALKISLILYNSLSPVSHPKFSGQPYDLEFFLEGMLYWISTATSPSDGKDLRRPLCAGVDTPIARSAGASSLKLGLLWTNFSTVSSAQFFVSFSCASILLIFMLENSSNAARNSLLLELKEFSVPGLLVRLSWLIPDRSLTLRGLDALKPR